MKNNEMTIEEQGIYRILCEKVGKRLLTQEGLYSYRDFREAMLQIFGYISEPNIGSIYLSLKAVVDTDIISHMDDDDEVRTENFLNLIPIVTMKDDKDDEKEPIKTTIQKITKAKCVTEPKDTTELCAKSDFSVIVASNEKVRSAFTNVLNCVAEEGLLYIKDGVTNFADWMGEMLESENYDLIDQNYNFNKENFLLTLWYFYKLDYRGESKTLKEWSEYDFASIDSDVNQKEDEKAEFDENEEDNMDESIASMEEMRIEAIQRMRKVIACSDIVDQFVENGLPQVYEPPYGASYALEDDELQMVRSTEKNYDVLIWGVIRCGMTYNREPVTVDCMLFVSNCKDEWEEERKELYDGNPYVYTQMKEYNVRDRGYINVYASPGGTLLRK